MPHIKSTAVSFLLLCTASLAAGQLSEDEQRNGCPKEGCSNCATVYNKNFVGDDLLKGAIAETPSQCCEFARDAQLPPKPFPGKEACDDYTIPYFDWNCDDDGNIRKDLASLSWVWCAAPLDSEGCDTGFGDVMPAGTCAAKFIDVASGHTGPQGAAGGSTIPAGSMDFLEYSKYSDDPKGPDDFAPSTFQWFSGLIDPPGITTDCSMLTLTPERNVTATAECPSTDKYIGAAQVAYYSDAEACCEIPCQNCSKSGPMRGGYKAGVGPRRCPNFVDEPCEEESS